MSTVDRPRPAPVAEVSFEGELIRRDDLPAVSRLWRVLDEHTRNVGKLKGWARDAILEHMDARSEWRIEVDGSFDVIGDPPSHSRPTWDHEKLAELRDVLPKDRVDELLKPTVTIVPDTRALQSIAKRDPDSAAGRIIAAAEFRTAAARGVRTNR